MAEAIGAAAAILQFLDVALRLTSCLDRFFSDVRNVPLRYHQLQTDLRQQSDLAKQIQTQLPSQAIASLAPNGPLVEYSTIADELCTKLETLLPKKTDGSFQECWIKLRAIRKKDEVEAICTRLEQKKGNVLMWLNAENLKLTSQIAGTAVQMKVNLDQTLTLTQSVNSSSAKIATDVEQLLQNVEHLDQITATSLQGTDRRLGDLFQQFNTHSTTILDRLEALKLQAESNTQMTVTTVSHTQQILQDVQVLKTQSASGNPGTRQRLGGDQLHIPSNRQAQQGTVLYPRIHKPCNCRSVSSARHWQPLPFLRITRTFRAQHFSYCPRYKNSKQSLEVMMQIVPSWWLYAINIGTQVNNWSTGGPFSISPILVGTTRLVDFNSSPAFEAMYDTYDELTRLEYNEQYSIKRYIPTGIIARLQSRLSDLFVQGKASVWDTQPDGNTLLHLKLIRDIPYVKIPEDEYSTIMRFLLDHGADPNACMFDYYSGKFSNVYDMVVDISVIGTRDYRAKNGLLNLLLEADGHASRPLFHLDCMDYDEVEFEKQSKCLRYFEEQIDICDLGDFVPLVIQKHKDFERIVRNASLSNLNRQSSVNGMAPIHFAVEWPDGLRVLIERGADVNLEDSFGRRPIDLAVETRRVDSFTLLLEANCRLFRPLHKPTLLQWVSRIYDDSMRVQFLDVLVPALADRHKKLLEYAGAKLPYSVASRLDMVPGQLYERHAPAIIAMLDSIVEDIPEYLYLDGRSVYDISAYDCYLSTEYFDMLWNAGFRDINEPDSHGFTPYLREWKKYNFHMAAWFVDKGVSVTSKHRDTHLTALHLYRHCPVGQEHTVQRYAEVIHRELGIPHDDCACVCSPRGCTPVKSSFRGNEFPGKSLERWIDIMKPPLSLLRQYLLEATKILLFEFLGGHHTCCSIDRHGAVTGPDEYYVLLPIKMRNDQLSWEHNHILYCNNDLPIPQLETFAGTGSVKAFNTALDSAMSHYDEMDRPDSMPFHEQPYEYIHWIIAKGYLVVGLKECTVSQHEYSVEGDEGSDIEFEDAAAREENSNSGITETGA